MAKIVAALTGAIASSALIYHFRTDIDSNTTTIRRKLERVQKQLKDIGHEETKISSESISNHSILPTLSAANKYTQQRLIPSIKDSWNAHIISLARSANDAISHVAATTENIPTFVTNDENKTSKK
ncbi:uncharacterized protein VTP21DRAFT_7808 [Calcarisporiella thermophila]|uniref:uncharacterized protein n=1 Tax=Calcarisporiella thermophila TaxID=911321 RepID=UPI0037422C40